MSTIAYKDGIIAADSRAYGGSWCPSPGEKTKVHRLKDGSYLGITSSKVGEAERFLAYMTPLEGEPNPKDAGDDWSFRAMRVFPDGKIMIANDSPWWAGPIETTFYSIGSGSDFAMGAMAMGASAIEAVKIACQMDPHSGEPVQAYTIR